MNSSGYLKIIIGPMFSGKTTSLIDIYERYNSINKHVYVVNYSGDTRYSDAMLSSHNNKTIPCMFAHRLRDIFSGEAVMDYHSADIILINEGQFFPDLYEVVVELVELYGKTVYVCGLDGDFKRRSFGQLSQLIPICDEVQKLSAKCSDCGNSAIFSHRISKEKEQIVIGSSNYKPLCRGCYLKCNN
jgi:thymidine kinase